MQGALRSALKGKTMHLKVENGLSFDWGADFGSLIKTTRKSSLF